MPLSGPGTMGRMGELSGDQLLALPVRLHGIQVGLPTDLLLDREVLRVVGLDVLCGDEVHRFLPLPTAAVRADELAILSPLVLLEEDELQFYRSRAFLLSSLRGRAVERKRREAGTRAMSWWHQTASCSRCSSNVTAPRSGSYSTAP